jgi:hypothetical protein
VLSGLPLEVDAEALGLSDLTMIRVLREDPGWDRTVSEVALLIVVNLSD